MASKRRNKFYKNKKQETTEIGESCSRQEHLHLLVLKGSSFHTSEEFSLRECGSRAASESATASGTSAGATDKHKASSPTAPRDQSLTKMKEDICGFDLNKNEITIKRPPPPFMRPNDVINYLVNTVL
ncbi:hypothetical protein AAG570_005108 [Ranatra chinensis]|uniref:Uncharacterized protein n=1 Tax=Ranatra chinensis TaxID=642074 RepID=A0ABD0XZK4_9HEMI